MKRYLAIISCILSLNAQAQQPTGFSLQGEVEGANSGKVYLQRFDNKIYRTIDSTEIADGKFKFAPDITLPEIYGLTLDPNGSSFMVFLEKSPVYVKLNAEKISQNSSVSGSALHDVFTEYKNSLQKEPVNISDFIRQNPASLVAAYVLYRDYSYRLSPEEIKVNLQLLDPSLQNTQYVTVLNGLVETMEKVSVGRTAPDFTSITPEGKEIKFSEHVGKGYLLLDF